jgi:L-ascorbate metabolism protein UlaG (beta-lactamase superfamily)
MEMHAALAKTGTCLLLVSASMLAVALTAATWAAAPQAAAPQALKKLTAGIHWLGHDSFRIEGNGLTVYIDPYRLKDGPKADIILIAHDHRDHASPDDVARILKPDTVIVTIAAAAEKLAGQIKTVKAGEELTVKGIPIRTLPAYNLTKFRSPGVPFHPRESGHVGYLITVNGVRIYHPGDSDFVPEMKGLEPDVALLPVSGIYVMTAEEAVEAAAAIQPKVAIPMHVGEGIGSLADAERFREKSTVPVIVLPIEK